MRVCDFFLSLCLRLCGSVGLSLTVFCTLGGPDGEEKRPFTGQSPELTFRAVALASEAGV